MAKRIVFGIMQISVFLNQAKEYWLHKTLRKWIRNCHLLKFASSL